MNRTVKKIYFIGIGGIGMSALAQWYKHHGFVVAGSDAVSSNITRLLKQKGIKVNIGASRRNIQKSTELVIYSSAVPAKNPERKQAKKFNIPQKTYAQALGEVTRLYQTIAICGTHGKSTTTAMAALMLQEAGFDPTVIVGTLVPQFKHNNFRAGKSDYLVIEADEYRAAFLHHHPNIIICTNVEADHLDYYKNFSNIKKTFIKFFTRLPKNGLLILNQDDKFLTRFKSAQTVFYSLKSPRAKAVKKALRVPGRHNIANALAVDALGQTLGISGTARERGLGKFTGTWRRFEYRGRLREVKIFDDYGHHPTEIKATLQAAKEFYPKSKIWCLFQPHQIDRLTRLFNDFTKAFADADQVAILETYKVKGREHKGRAKTAQDLAQKIKATYLPNHKAAVEFVKTKPQKGDIVILMGAGDINLVTDRIVK